MKVRSSSGIRRRSAGLAALGLERGDLLLREVAVEVVVAQLGVPAGRPVAGLDLFRRGVATRRRNPPSISLSIDILVDVAALRLAVGLMRAAHFHALVPADAQPLERLQQLVVALLAVPRRVRVLDPENQLALGVPRVGPVEQGGADQPDVRGAGGRGAEPDPDGGFSGDRGVGIRGRR